ncbi:MAG: redoxin domain-containing protein [Saprospiraceae bacterium]|nr:redoxin domain-containing protein [Candidatus Vicinibacter proximus]MBL7824081.1 redoxin domain-containing protein [Saprospiraceae bacterium]MCC6842173.1 redoxin domain-containing protein [Saprospiraceae bacterium]HRG32867.1 redoxin domain-containing protein [Saprospiraceae bacterium]
MRQFTFFLFLLPFICSAAKAPDFTITDYNNKTHTLYSDYLKKEKVVVLKLFFVACPPCNAIAPYVQQAYTRWGAGNGRVQFIELSTQNYDLNNAVKGYAQKHGITFPGAGVDGGGFAAVAPYKSGTFGPFYGTPTFLVIAPNGEVEFNIDFERDDQVKLDSAIARALRVSSGGTGGGPTRCVDSFGVKIISHLQPDKMIVKDIFNGNNPIFELADNKYNCEYFFPAIRDNYYVTPFKSQTGDPLEYVTTADIVLIQKHILGIAQLNNLQLLVADVNKTYSVTASDMAEIRKLILGINSRFKAVSDLYGFANNPAGKNGIISDKVKLNDLIKGTASNEFGVGKYGDVNGAAIKFQGEQQERSICMEEWIIKSEKTSNGYLYHIIPNTNASVVGFQFSLACDISSITDVILNQSLSNFNNNNYKLNGQRNEFICLWSSPDGLGVKFDLNDPLITFSSSQNLNFKQGKVPNEIVLENDICGIFFNHIYNSEPGAPRFRVNQTATQYEIDVEASSGIVALKFFDQSGIHVSDAKIKMEKINEQNIKANISKLNPGLYFVQGQLADGSIKTERFFKID